MLRSPDSVVSFKPYSMKKVALPIAAASMTIGFARVKYIITTSEIATKAKCQTPCFSKISLDEEGFFLFKEKSMEV